MGINDQCSIWQRLTEKSVSLGSMLGPVVFNRCIHDLEKGMSSDKNLTKFARRSPPSATTSSNEGRCQATAASLSCQAGLPHLPHRGSSPLPLSRWPAHSSSQLLGEASHGRGGERKLPKRRWLVSGLPYPRDSASPHSNWRPLLFPCTASSTAASKTWTSVSSHFTAP